MALAGIGGFWDWGGFSLGWIGILLPASLVLSTSKYITSTVVAAPSPSGGDRGASLW